jgi:YaiO family outer membrane protein
MKKALISHCLVLFALGGCASGQDNPQTSLAQADAPETSKYEVQLQYSHETLTRNFGTWRTASLYLERKFSKRKIVWANYRVSDRNSNRDQEFVGGFYTGIGRRWAITGEAMVSPSHKYVGKFSTMLAAERIMGKGIVAHVGARFTAYDTVKASTAYGLTEKYWGNNRAAYTFYATSLTNTGIAPTHRIQYNRYFGERVNSVGTAVTFGREHENLGPNLGILRSRTWSISGSARYWFTERVGVNVDGLIHRQDDIYYRRGLNLGIRYRF